MNKMRSFADLITEEEAQAIQAWVILRATRDPSALDHVVRWLADSSFCLHARWLTH